MADAMPFHRGHPAGTVLRAKRNPKIRIRMTAPMLDDWGFFEYIKKDGTRDRRTVGWSGSLPLDCWEVVR